MHRNTIFRQFFESGKAGGLILISCTVIALWLANSPVGGSFLHFWHLPAPLLIGKISVPFSIEDWINDGLMTVFFLLVGLEIKRELFDGELSTGRKAILPVLAAIGGMAIPAGIHYLMNHGTATQAGFGIPMATDIAFSLGVLSLLGSRIPVGMKIFLTALAIIDDLGAIIIIAIFYTGQFSLLFLTLGLGLTGVLALLGRAGVKTGWLYIPAGLILWYLFYRSGIHPTLSGVLLAFVIPSQGSAGTTSLSDRVEQALHQPVALLIVPLFALANTAIPLPADWTGSLLSQNSLGIGLGLLVGKCAGIAGFSIIAVRTGLAAWPEGMNVRKLFGLALLGGIGFTMSVFISNLAFPGDEARIGSSKVAVLTASLVCALGGWSLLRHSVSRR